MLVLGFTTKAPGRCRRSLNRESYDRAMTLGDPTPGPRAVSGKAASSQSEVMLPVSPM